MVERDDDGVRTMKVQPPCVAIDFTAHTIEEQTLRLSALRGKAVILSFFRDAASPFCNKRVFEYSEKFKEWDELGIVVVAVFSSNNHEIREFVAKHPRPFISIGDPQLAIYNKYGVEESSNGLFRALLFCLPRLLSGFRLGANVNIKDSMGGTNPADFLISPTGKIVDLWYGDNPCEHMPMKRIEKFVSKVRRARIKQAERRKMRKLVDRDKDSHLNAHSMSLSEMSVTVVSPLRSQTKVSNKKDQTTFKTKPS